MLESHVHRHEPDRSACDSRTAVTGSSLNGVVVSSVAQRARWTAHSWFCSSRIADETNDGFFVTEDADHLGSYARKWVMTA